MTDYPPEQIYELHWWGPYTLKKLEKEDDEYLQTICLYAKYEDHPLYGRRVLTYIGKAVDQPLLRRLNQHDLDEEVIYVATVRPFISWSESDAQHEKAGYDLADYTRDGEIISRIEELLIYALWPAANIRNKNSASGSWSFRIFNTGHLGDLPPEISGHYALANAPDPDNPLES